MSCSGLPRQFILGAAGNYKRILLIGSGAGLGVGRAGTLLGR